jgi:eukaryotic-like serine/threonine-protein kinase
MILPNRYTLYKKITGGGMSETLVCIDGNLERKVLLKSVNDSVDQHRLIDEIKALQTIRSRHVVQIFDVVRDSDGGIVAIVEEYVEGRHLLLSDFVVEKEANLKILYQIAKGISDIHASGQIHRDIKNENMLLDGEGYVKIFDFGLAKSSSKTGSAYTQSIIGTPGHMAPELFKSGLSGSYAFSGAVDVFAYAASVLRSMSGWLPPELLSFPPTSQQSPTFFDGIGIGMPANLREKLNRALSADPLVRPSMHEIAQALEREMLRDRHKVFIRTNANTYKLDSNSRSIALKADGKGQFSLRYDGYDIIISQIQGEVYVNNMVPQNGTPIPKCCVVVLGAPALGSARSMVTVDSSHPGVDL